MKTMLQVVLLACAVCVCGVATAHAQGAGSFELGVDGVMSFRVTEDARNLTRIALPPAFRVGYFPTESLGMEGSLSVAYLKYEDLDDRASISFGLDVVAHIESDRGIRFFQVGLRSTYANFGGANDEARFGVGAAVGFKPHVGDRIAIRTSLGAERFFEGDSEIREPAYTRLLFSIGVSFFTS